MEETSVTLLARVRDGRDQNAWREFFALYYPLVCRYARERGLRLEEAEEVAQDCMQKLAEYLRDFQYASDRGRFRGFLRRMVNNRITDLYRRQRLQVVPTCLEHVAAPDEDKLWDRIWLHEHLTFCVERLEARCRDHTVAAFKMYAIEGRPAEEVGAHLGITLNQVYLAKSRVIQRLREEVGDVVEELAAG